MARRHSRAKKTTVSTFDRAKLHHHQFMNTPLLQIKPQISSGVPAPKVVATIDVPDSHQGSSRPDRKKSVVLFLASR